MMTKSGIEMHRWAEFNQKDGRAAIRNVVIFGL